MELKFLVQGRSSSPYEVQFFRDSGSDNMTALCTCRAGIFGNFCKHRIRLLTGDATGFVGENENEIKLVGEMAKGSDIEEVLKEFFIKEGTFKVAEAEFKAVKKELSAAMND